MDIRMRNDNWYPGNVPKWRELRKRWLKLDLVRLLAVNLLLVLVFLLEKGMFAQIQAVGVVSLSDLASPGM